MAYEFRLTGTRSGPVREAMNPFTGEPGMMPTFVMSDEERDAALSVIQRHGGTITAGDGAVELTGAKMTFREFDGPHIEVSIAGAIESAIDVLFEIATAGRLVVMNSHEKCDDPVPVVTTSEAAAQAESSGAEPEPPEVVTDVGRFLQVLLPGYEREASRRGMS